MNRMFFNNFIKFMEISVVFSLILFILAGCTGQGAGQVNYDSDENYRVGVEGAKIEFMDNLPPKEVVEGSLVQLGITLKNKGAYNITDGFLSINLDEDYLELSSIKTKTVSLDGKNKFNPEGGEDIIIFSGNTKLLESQSTSHRVPVTASFCYTYETIYDGELCVDVPYINKVNQGTPVCDVSNLNPGALGSPITIDEVVFNMLSSEQRGFFIPVFEIHLTHRGKGFVLNKNNYRSVCTAGGSPMSTNEVHFRATLSDVELDCSKSDSGNVYQLRNGESVIRCTGSNIDERSIPYVAPIRIELDYGYLARESRFLEIKRG